MIEFERLFISNKSVSRGTDWKYAARLTPYGRSLKEKTDLIRIEIANQFKDDLGNIKDQMMSLIGIQENAVIKKFVQLWSKASPARLYDLKQCETWPERFTRISNFAELQREYFEIVRAHYGYDLLVSEYKEKVATRLVSKLSNIGLSIEDLDFPFQFPINLPNTDFILEALDPAYPSIGERPELSQFFKKLRIETFTKGRESFDWKQKIAFSELSERDQKSVIEDATVFLQLSEIELAIIVEESVPVTFMRRCLLQMANDFFGRPEEIFLLSISELIQISERRSFDFISIIDKRFAQWQSRRGTENGVGVSNQKALRSPAGRYFQGQRIGVGDLEGPAYWISDFEDIVNQSPGDVCFVERAFPAYVWVVPSLTAVVFNKLEPHSEIGRVARAYSIPCVAGYRGGRENISARVQIRVESSAGRICYP